MQPFAIARTQVSATILALALCTVCDARASEQPPETDRNVDGTSAPEERVSPASDSPDPLRLWERIQRADATGDDEVWDLEQELVTWATSHPDEPAAVIVLRDLGNRQLQRLERVIAGDPVPRGVSHYCLGQEGAEGDCYSGSRTTIVHALLAEASRSYAEAILILLRAESYASEDLRTLEVALVRGAELIRQYARDRSEHSGPGLMLMPMSPSNVFSEPWRSRIEPIMALAEWDLPYDVVGRPEEDFLRQRAEKRDRFTNAYYRGRQSLCRLYAYEIAVSSSALKRAAALVQIADWDLLFERNGLALEGYALALQMLEDAGADARSIAELFAPPVPAVLPTFEPSPFASDATRAAAGSIDVEFELTRYGRARDFKIRNEVNATDVERAELIARLKISRFRPKLTDGAFADSLGIAARYYFYD